MLQKIISRFEDGTKVGYGKGSFDDWCVYVAPATGREYAPRDIEYFGELLDISKLYGNHRLYNDFVKIYDQTTRQVSDTVLRQIFDISRTYEQHTGEVRLLFTIIYLAMIAEENKKIQN